MAVPRVRDDVVHRDAYGQIRLIRLVVFGKPVQQGSKKQIRPGVWVEDAHEALGPWRDSIASSARSAQVGMLDGPLQCNLVFYYGYRKGDLRANGDPKPSTPIYKLSVPDLDKLTRAVLDGLTKGGIWADDSQVVVLTAEKRYAPTPGVRIEIRPLGGADGQEPTQGSQGHAGVQGGQASLWVEDGAGGQEP